MTTAPYDNPDREELKRIVSSGSDTEDKSEEIQAIIDRMPVRFAHRVFLIVSLFSATIITLSCIIRYPDTVDGEITVSSQHAPVRMVANANGRLLLFKTDRSRLKTGETIAYIENAARYEDVILLDSLLRQPPTDDIIFPDTIILGEISSAYNNFMLSRQQYLLHEQSLLFETRRESIRLQIQSDSIVLGNIAAELALKAQSLDLLRQQLKKDSAIYEVKAITETQLQERLAAFLTANEAYQALLIDEATIKARIRAAEIEWRTSAIEEKETRHKLTSEMNSRTNELKNSIAAWKERYVFTSPMYGVLEYLGFWKNDMYLENGKEVFSVIPAKQDIFGEVIIPTTGSGNIKTGQSVNVKLNNFPYDEYGMLNGTVTSISTITHKSPVQNGYANCYLVRVDFPEGTVTNYGKTLDLNFETTGIAEIITREKKLIQRLFDNLKTQTVK